MLRPASLSRWSFVSRIAPLSLKSNAKTSWLASLVPIVAPIISGLIALGGVWLGLRVGENNTEKTISAAIRSSEAVINQRANEAELSIGVSR